MTLTSTRCLLGTFSCWCSLESKEELTSWNDVGTLRGRGDEAIRGVSIETR